MYVKQKTKRIHESEQQNFNYLEYDLQANLLNFKSSPLVIRTNLIIGMTIGFFEKVLESFFGNNNNKATKSKTRLFRQEIAGLAKIFSEFYNKRRNKKSGS